MIIFLGGDFTKKKILASLLILTSIVSAIQPIQLKADTVNNVSNTNIYQTYIDNSAGRKSYVLDRLSTLESIISDSQSDIVSEAKQGAALIEYCSWVIAMKDDTTFANIRNYFGTSNYQKLAKKFNDRYFENNDVPMIICAENVAADTNPEDLDPKKWETTKKLKEIKKDEVDQLMQYVVGKWGPYFMDQIAVKLGLSDDNVSDSSKRAGAYVYKVYLMLPKTMKNMYTNVDNGAVPTGASIIIDNEFVYSKDSTTPMEMHEYATGYLLKTYGCLSDGYSLLQKNETLGTLTTDTTKKPLENLANVTYNADNDTYDVPEDVELSAAFEAFFAASAAYVPFVSYSGSQEFQSVVTSLCSDASTASDVLALYNENKNLRKPLYKRELDANGDPTGVATLVTIDDFITIIEEGQSYAFCTIKGELVKDKETGTWIYRTKKNSPEYQDLEDLNLDLGYDDSDSEGELLAKLLNSMKPMTVQAAQLQDPVPLDIPGGEGSTLIENAEATQAATPKPSSKPTSKPTSKPSDNEHGTTDEQVPALTQAAQAELTKAAQASTTPQPSDATTDTGTTDVGEGTQTDVSASVSDSGTGTATADGTATTDEDGNVKVSVDTYNKLPAYQEITEESAMTDPVLMTSSSIYRAVDNMTYMLMYNVLKSTVTTDLIFHSSTRYLYLNAFGDIVMDDNLVIMPAAANPIYYKADVEYPLATAAFQNSYPAINAGLTFRTGSEQDIDKYVLMKGDSESAPYKIAKIVSNKKIEETKLHFRDLTAYMSKEFSATNTDNLVPIMTERYYFTTGTLIVPCSNISINHTKVFPYYPILDISKNAAKAIARSMYVHLAMDQETNEVKNNKLLNDNYILNYVLKTALDGTEMVDSFTSDMMMQYDEYEENSFERFSNALVALTDSIEDSMSYERGVLSLKNPYTTQYVGAIYNWVRDNIFYVLVLIVIFIVLCYVRNRVDFIKLGVLVAFNVGLTIAFIYYLPNLSTYAFNFLTNNISQNMAYEVLAIKSEILSNEGNSTAFVNSEGRADKCTSSLTLHKYTRSELEDFTDGFSTDSTSYTGGKIYLVNSDTGLFVENDCLKMNVDKVFANLKIKGGYDLETKTSTADKVTDEDATVTSSYKIVAYKTVSDNLDYYTPYYEFVDGFIAKLNTMIEVCQTVPTQIVYSDGTIKDSFAVYSYLNSPMFVTPGQYTNELDQYSDLVLSPEDQNKDQDSMVSDADNDISIDALDASQYFEGFAKQAEALEKSFGSSKDWLGISGILLAVAGDDDRAKELRKTVWARTMRENGYYYEDWTCNNFRIAELVAYVNKETKKFAIDIDSMLKNVSDDVLVKMICLRALTAFNQEIMTKDAIAYPLFLNYDEISIHDVLTALVVDDIAMFSAVDQSLAQYINKNNGWFMVIILLLTILLMFTFVLVINVTIPILCLIFTFMLIFKLSNYLDSKSLVKGFCKVIGLLALDFTLFSCGISLINSFEGGVITLVSIMSLVGVCTLFYKFVISAVFTNFSDLGNVAVTAKLKDFASKIGGLKPLRNLSAQNLITGGGQEDESDVYDSFSQYQDGADIDQMYLGNDYVNYWEDDR